MQSFLTRLATDRQARSEYEHDPEAMLASSSLASAEVDAVRSGDSEQIRRLLSSDFPAPTAVTSAES